MNRISVILMFVCLVFLSSCFDNTQLSNQNNENEYYGFDVQNYNHDMMADILNLKYVYVLENESFGITYVIVNNDKQIEHVRKHLLDNNCILLAEYSLRLVHKP